MVLLGLDSVLGNRFLKRECLDIIGITSQLEADALQETFVKVFEKLLCNICLMHLQACQKVRKNNSTFITKFSGRKYCQQALSVKKTL